MQKTILRSGCKINLTLRILNRRADGLHNLDTVFFPLSEPHDELILDHLPDFSEHPDRSDGGSKDRCRGTDGKQESETFVLERVTFRDAIVSDSLPSGLSRSNTPDLDLRKNTLTTAYTLFATASGFRPRLRATLIKGVPSGAGLGGGSADAASLLLWLNARAAQADLALPPPALADIAAQVGADVPFFLGGKPCRGRGIGTDLDPCDPVNDLGLAGWGLLLLCPAVQVSTPRAYAAYDTWQDSILTRSSETDIQRHLLHTGETGKDRVFWFENSFECPVFQALPELARLKTRLLREGAAAAVMSGSGASLFALFRRSHKAFHVAQRLRESGMVTYCHTL